MTRTQTIEKLISLFRSKKQTLSLAESCTGGLCSAQIVALPGVSDIFLGSVVSYSDSAKKNLLHVSAADLNQFGAVSETVALAMSGGAQKAFASDWSLSITGIAGPGGGTSDKPVGTVCFAVHGPKTEMVFTKKFTGTRQQIQSQSVDFALSVLQESLDNERG